MFVYMLLVIIYDACTLMSNLPIKKCNDTGKYCLLIEWVNANCYSSDTCLTFSLFLFLPLQIDTILACGGLAKNPLFIQEHADIIGLSLSLCVCVWGGVHVMYVCMLCFLFLFFFLLLRRVG